MVPNQTMWGSHPLLAELKTSVPDVTIDGAHTKLITSLSFSGNSEWFISGGLDKAVKLWDTNSRQLLATFMGNSPVLSVAFSPISAVFASAGEDHLIQFWDVRTRSIIATYEMPETPVFTLCFHPNGQFLAAGSAGGLIILIQVGTRQEEYPPAVIQAHHGDVRALSFSADGSLLISGGEDRVIRLFDVNSLKEGKLPDRIVCVRSYEGHTGPVCGLSFAGDSVSFMSVSRDTTARLWHVENGTHTAFEHLDELYSVCFSPESTAFLVGGMKERRLWEARQCRIFPEKRQPVVCHTVSISPDCSTLLSASGDSLRVTWNVQHAKTLLKFFAKHHHQATHLPTDSWRSLIRALRDSEQSINSIFNPEGGTLLHSAVTRLDLTSIRRAIDLGVNVNTQNQRGWTALHVAVSVFFSNFLNEKSSIVPIISSLIDAGTDVNLPDSEGNTCLHLVVPKDDIALAQTLLLSGSDTTIRNKWGMTPATLAKSLDMLNLLLQHAQKRSEKPASAPAPAASTSPVSSSSPYRAGVANPESVLGYELNDVKESPASDPEATQYEQSPRASFDETSRDESKLEDVEIASQDGQGSGQGQNRTEEGERREPSVSRGWSASSGVEMEMLMRLQNLVEKLQTKLVQSEEKIAELTQELDVIRVSKSDRE
eukprot:TRINITY_DN1952_c0_g1_i1.p1 TRINITY_DN1952_c0_g1~~TRINITY_DN1952_c0_g1_i1.p1  ORF type:complete len:655 (+),score=116.63 TRINITY_DN1952_c0_g1_i1:93-2057(+)